MKVKLKNQLVDVKQIPTLQALAFLFSRLKFWEKVAIGADLDGGDTLYMIRIISASLDRTEEWLGSLTLPELASAWVSVCEVNRFIHALPYAVQLRDHGE